MDMSVYLENGVKAVKEGLKIRCYAGSSIPRPASTKTEQEIRDKSAEFSLWKYLVSLEEDHRRNNLVPLRTLPIEQIEEFHKESLSAGGDYIGHWVLLCLNALPIVLPGDE